MTRGNNIYFINLWAITK